MRKDYGNLIKEKREQLGWSQPDLSRTSGVPQQTVSRIEKKPMSLSAHLPALMTALGLPYTPQGGTKVPTIGDRIKVFATEPSEGGKLAIKKIVVRSYARHEHFEDNPSIYAITMPNSAMYPAIFPGDIVVVNPHHPAFSGRIALFVDEAGERSTIGEYLSEDAESWKIRQFGVNPRETTIPKSDYPLSQSVMAIIKLT